MMKTVMMNWKSLTSMMTINRENVQEGTVRKKMQSLFYTENLTETHKIVILSV